MSYFGLIFSVALLHFLYCGNALKCRTGEETHQNEDFEYVVRMCLRQLKNNTSYQENGERTFQSMFDPDKYKKDRNRMFTTDRNYRNQEDRGNNGGFEYFWGQNGNGNAGGRNNDRDKYHDQQNGDRSKDRDHMDHDYMENPDYIHVNPMRGVSGDNRGRIRPRPPHTYQQQIQYDRDMSYGYSHHRDYPYLGYQNSDRNKNGKRTSNRDKKGDSALEQLDPCMIQCIFQEMHMLDENGKPDKRTVSEKMSQKIRNPELKSFIQDSIDECFEEIEEEESTWNNRGGNARNGAADLMCVWAKNFAICLEEKGKDSCEDWDEPIHRNANNKGKEEQKNKNKDGKTGNSNSSNRG